MIAAIVNALAVVLCSGLGLALGGRLKNTHVQTVVAGLGICTTVIGMSGAIGTSNILIVILCLVLGTFLGELLKIEQRLDLLGEWLKTHLAKQSSSRFTEGFVTASLLFCVGSMAILGSFDAGIRRDYTTIFAKTAMDSVMAVTFAATMGVGVLFSGGAILVYQGALTLLAGLVEPYLSAQVITEISAVGGVILIATGINILGLSHQRIRVGNMLPAMVLPALYFYLIEILPF